MRLALIALACSLAGAAPRARADDWLAALATPAGEGGAPELVLIYPRPELPAVVAAGDVLMARVRLPGALTPPPGVQQDRALNGFAGELIGGGWALHEAARHRHHLTVLAVRPEGGSGLVYRVRFALPAYLAPGTYAFAVRTPFGERQAPVAVRVLQPGAAARLAPCPQPSAAETELATLPVDVWLCEDDTKAPQADSLLGQLPQPRLVLHAARGRALALRVGGELWLARPTSVGSEPGSAELVRDRVSVEDGLAEFARDVVDAAATEHRTPVELTAELLAQRLQPVPPEALTPLVIERSDGAIALDLRASSFARELTLLLPAAASLRADRALSLYPAGDLQVHEVRTIVGVWRVPARGRARLEWSLVAAAKQAYVLAATRVRSGSSVRLRVQGAADDARVAFEYGRDESAFTGPELRASFAGPLEQPVRALVLPRTGGARLLRARVLVEPSRPPNCGVGSGQRRYGPATGSALLFVLAFLLKRRSARGLGNRLGPDGRCERRDGPPHGTPHPNSELSATALRARRL